jgi:hypothetical protein
MYPLEPWAYLILWDERLALPTNPRLAIHRNSSASRKVDHQKDTTMYMYYTIHAALDTAERQPAPRRLKRGITIRMSPLSGINLSHSKLTLLCFNCYAL